MSREGKAIVGLLLVLVALLGFFGFHSYERQRQEDRDKQLVAEAAKQQAIQNAEAELRSLQIVKAEMEDDLAKQKRTAEQAKETQPGTAAAVLRADLRQHGVTVIVVADGDGILTATGNSKDKAAFVKRLHDPKLLQELRKASIRHVRFKDEADDMSSTEVN